MINTAIWMKTNEKMDKQHVYIQIHIRECNQNFRTGRLEWELQMVQLSVTRCSCIAILWVSLESFASITLCLLLNVCLLLLFVSLATQSWNFWTQPRTWISCDRLSL
jgi:hypothetical protein